METIQKFIEDIKENGFLGKKRNLICPNNSTKTIRICKKYIQKLYEITSWLPENFSKADRMATKQQNIDQDAAKCPVCGGLRKFNKRKRIWASTCGKKDKEHLNFINEARLEKIRATNREKYGVDFFVEADEFKEKSTFTNLTKYGVDNFAKTELFLKKFKETFQRKYDVNNPMQNKDIKKRVKLSFIKKYGVKTPMQVPEIKEKVKKVNLKKYGSEYYQQSPSYINRLESAEGQQALNVNSDDLKEQLQELFINDRDNFDINKFMEVVGCSETTAYKIMRDLGINYKKRKGVSLPEEKIVSFIKELDPDTEIITNSKKIIPPKELDIYLPEYNLAIEYNGLMFHSQGVSKYPPFNTPELDRNIHLAKTEACEAKGIHLLHIFENEWLDPKLQEIWKSVIKNKLKLAENKVGARKCEFAPKRLMNAFGKQFLEENHLQGGLAIGPIRYGLTYNKELVALMTFGKSRFGEADYELIRFAIKRNWSIPGAASKLLKAFEREHPNAKLVSYANRRWSDGNLYKALGFQLKNIAEPNYYYFHPSNIFKLWHRASFQKHKLKDKLELFDENLTEQENMFMNGYRRIYDSGNYVFIKN